MFYQFRHSDDFLASHQKDCQEFAKFYSFHEELGEFERMLEECGFNNLEYWQ